MSSETPFNPDERRIETMMDGSGYSRYLAEAETSEGMFAGATETPYVTRSRQPQATRRGGRSYPELSGRDVARQIANEAAMSTAVSPEQQREINRRGLAKIEKFRKQNELDRGVERAKARTEADPYDPVKAEHQEILAINAFMRTISDRRNRSS